MPALNEELLAFIGKSPTPFHAVANMSALLDENGFKQLDEGDYWSQTEPGRYYVIRNQSSIVAFVLGSADPIETGIRLVGAHTDSPCLRVKPNPVTHKHSYLQLGVEVYGGVLLNPWFDRDLSLAGRITYSDGSSIHNRLIDFTRAAGVIPSLAIHLDRNVNDSRSINPQKHIPPILLQTDETSSIDDLLQSQLEEEHNAKGKILGYELSFYDTNPPAFVGINNDFIASARLDNLLSCFVGLKALLSADGTATTMLVCNDHEEVGSASAAGAQGPFLKSVIERLFPDGESRHRITANSLLVSTDNAHGIHPNYADKHDANHGPVLNQGPVIKINANQRYATNSETEAYFAHLCEQTDVPYQKFTNRTDLACGSTIGPITATEIGVRTLDVGVPTFAMHSIRELAGSRDSDYLYRVLTAFLNVADSPGAK
ncbi:MAG TPA: M18 family aminopeptidase [Gammaproteobacteria bacterium]|nr:M18 family aminopeptidase [Gammaproteobacteria bacterium]|tara:strand:+ start:3154 stop:4440 length:1287 start_codon:yes stop_codon:yes gene_type:complete